mgnify:CR=1 FL=1
MNEKGKSLSLFFFKYRDANNFLLSTNILQIFQVWKHSILFAGSDQSAKVPSGNYRSKLSDSINESRGKCWENKVYEEKADRTAKGINSTARKAKRSGGVPARCTNRTCDREFFAISCKRGPCFVTWKLLWPRLISRSLHAVDSYNYLDDWNFHQKC